MVKLLLKCPKCRKYSINTTILNESKDNTPAENLIDYCLDCKIKLKTPHPPKFSMDNKYLKYIRELKELMK